MLAITVLVAMTFSDKNLKCDDTKIARLVHGDKPGAGFVQFYDPIEERWGYVCDDDGSDSYADNYNWASPPLTFHNIRVVCKELGYTCGFNNACSAQSAKKVAAGKFRNLDFYDYNYAENYPYFESWGLDLDVEFSVDKLFCFRDADRICDCRYDSNEHCSEKEIVWVDCGQEKVVSDDHTLVIVGISVAGFVILTLGIFYKRSNSTMNGSMVLL